MNKIRQKVDIYKIGSYEINKNKKLGSGSYSVVYLGRSLTTDRIVAIKKINLSGTNENVTKMIKEEITIMEKIKKNPHENIVECIDIIDDIDTVYIIMEYCDGGDISKILGIPINEETAKNYFHQIVSGLKYLADNKIIHRDIKPKNILITNNNTKIKICDFGLAKIKESMSRIFTICGSPLYMAPELLREKSYDHGVDIWALGMILYELLFGHHPFYRCKDIEELKDTVNNDEIDIPENKLSKDCLQMLRLLLEKDDTVRVDLNSIKNHNWLKNIKPINNSNKLIDEEDDEIFYEDDEDFIFDMD